jgi:hypothetical protein
VDACCEGYLQGQEAPGCPLNAKTAKWQDAQRALLQVAVTKAQLYNHVGGTALQIDAKQLLQNTVDQSAQDKSGKPILRLPNMQPSREFQAEFTESPASVPAATLRMMALVPKLAGASTPKQVSDALVNVPLCGFDKRRGRGFLGARRNSPCFLGAQLGFKTDDLASSGIRHMSDALLRMIKLAESTPEPQRSEWERELLQWLAIPTRLRPTACGAASPAGDGPPSLPSERETTPAPMQTEELRRVVQSALLPHVRQALLALPAGLLAEVLADG